MSISVMCKIRYLFCLIINIMLNTPIWLVHILPLQKVFFISYPLSLQVPGYSQAFNAKDWTFNHTFDCSTGQRKCCRLKYLILQCQRLCTLIIIANRIKNGTALLSDYIEISERRTAAFIYTGLLLFSSFLYPTLLSGR